MYTHYYFIFFRIFTKEDTGDLTEQVMDKLFKDFKESSKDDIFFLNEEFTEEEKHLLKK